MSFERTVGKAYGRALVRSCVVGAVGLVVGISMVAAVLWIAGGRNASAESYRPLIALAFPMVVIALVLLVGAAFVVRRNRRLDRAMGWLGVEGHQVGGVLRGWHGEHAGRRLDIWFGKGPMLEIYLGCDIATRGGIGHRNQLGRHLAKTFADQEPLTLTPTAADGCMVFADDEDWMRRWLGLPRVADPLARLLSETPRVSPMLVVTPKALHYVRRFDRLAAINRDNLERWIGDLETLAQEADAVGPSISGAEPSQLDEWGRTRRGRRFLPKFIGCALASIFVFWILLMAFFYWRHYT